VLSRFAADFEHPTSHEGYDRIISLKPTDHTSPVYSRSEIAAILQRVYDFPPDVFAVNNPQSFRGRHSFRGNSFRGHLVRNNIGPSGNRGPRGRGYASMGSLNPYPAWQSFPARGNPGLRGLDANTSHFGQGGFGQHKPSIFARNQSQHTIAREVGGNGTAQNPFTIT
jgi:hypothetical protein